MTVVADGRREKCRSVPLLPCSRDMTEPRQGLCFQHQIGADGHAACGGTSSNETTEYHNSGRTTRTVAVMASPNNVSCRLDRPWDRHEKGGCHKEADSAYHEFERVSWYVTLLRATLLPYSDSED